MHNIGEDAGLKKEESLTEIDGRLYHSPVNADFMEDTVNSHRFLQHKPNE
jgi:hypothetical protein